MLRVTGAAAVSHHPELMSLAKALRHLLAELADCAGVMLEELLLDLDRFPALVHDFLTPGIGLQRRLRALARGSARLRHAEPPMKIAVNLTSSLSRRRCLP